MKRIIKAKEEEDILVYLKKYTDYSNKKLKSMIEHKQILVNQKSPKMPYLLKVGDEIFLTTEKIIKVPFSILYEDDKLIAINKKSGLLTVGNEREKEATLYHQVYEYLHLKKEKVFVVHRLDKDTSGIVVFAKTEEVKNTLQENWNSIVSSRKYVAVVHGISKEKGRIETYLKEEKNTFVHSASTGKLAITEYGLIKSKNNLSLIDITLLTGRKNQIRVHMSENHTPIVGDKKYGRKDSFARLYLHCYELSFFYPKTKQEYKFKTEIPKEFLKTVL